MDRLVVSGVAFPFTDAYYLTGVLTSESVTVFAYYAGITVSSLAVVSVVWLDDDGWFEKTLSETRFAGAFDKLFLWCWGVVHLSVVVGIGGGVAALLHEFGFSMVAALVAVGLPAESKLWPRGTRLVSQTIAFVFVLTLFPLLFVAVLLYGLLSRSSNGPADCAEAVSTGLVAIVRSLSN